MLGTKILEERVSKFNGNIRVVRTWGMGIYIQADGLTQSGGIVESIWEETLKKIVNSKLLISNCLILGLGGGTVAKLVKKNWPKAKIVGIDIDPDMVELGKKYLGLDEGVNVKIQDADKPLSDDFDLVIVDLYQGDRFPKKFGDALFLKSLSKYKLVVFNRLYYKDKKKEAEKFGKSLKKFFKKVEYFYPTVNLMFFCYRDGM